MSVDIETLVHQIESILFAIITQDVLFPVSIAKLHHFAPNEVTNIASCIGEGKAVG